MIKIMLRFLCFVLIIFSPLSVQAQDAPSAFRATDLPLPRFVSLKSSEIFMCSGPGMRYPVQWVYRRAGWPVEIVLEFENWRKIRDIDGESGWVHHSLLSGRRTGIARGDEDMPVLSKPGEKGRLRAYLESGVLLNIRACEYGWCRIEVEGYQGWMERKFIWGIYEDENFD